MLAAFVGYHVAAITGAVVAAATVFLPAFALVLLTIPILHVSTRGSRRRCAA